MLLYVIRLAGEMKVCVRVCLGVGGGEGGWAVLSLSVSHHRRVCLIG
jgi:hypothetical protein